MHEDINRWTLNLRTAEYDPGRTYSNIQRIILYYILKNKT